MDALTTTAIIQGGAVMLLAFVLWQVSKKIDRAFDMVQALTLRLIDLIDDTRQIAAEATKKSDRNYTAITGDKPPPDRQV